MYTPPSFLDEEDEISGKHPGEWRVKNTEGMVNFVQQNGNRHAKEALRDRWCNYFYTSYSSLARANGVVN